MTTTSTGTGDTPPLDPKSPPVDGTTANPILMMAGTPQPLTIGDRVWRDLNANGKQDPGEPGIANVTLQLYHGVTLVGTAITDPTGKYTFDKLNVFNGTVNDPSDDGLLPNTQYKITIRGDETALAGLRLTPPDAAGDDTLDSDGTANGTGAAVDVTTGENGGNNTVDFGYATAGSIGNMVWNDANNNGIRDVGENGLGGVKVRLLDETGTTELATTMTADDGTYLFSNLLPGTYLVEVMASNFASGGALVGYSSSTGKPGQPGPSPYEGSGVAGPNSNKTDSDDNGTTANGVVRALPVTVGTLAAGPDNRTVDFGFYKGGALTGRVYLDANADGKPDETETTGIANVRIRAVGPTGAFMAKTDADGNFSLPNLPAGDYTVSEVNQPVGYHNSSPSVAKITFAPGETGAAYFGETPAVDLKLTQSVSKSVAKLGEVVTITYKVQNIGTLAATNVQVKAPIGNGLKYVSSDVGTTTATYDPAASTFALADLAPGAEAVFRVQVRITRVGVITHRAAVTAHEAEDVVTNNVATTNLLSPTTPAPVQQGGLTPLQLWWLAAYWFRR
ncbi:MAG TPA: SdrD B-like domain-containing protein [Gemmataceae bacterium]|nr:SdrD B-like domain-containing protein [Gemmataceae bacterium]